MKYLKPFAFPYNNSENGENKVYVFANYCELSVIPVLINALKSN